MEFATNKESSEPEKSRSQNSTSKATTVAAKYIFLDIVGFTQNRSVEAQTDIIGALNQIVSDSVKSVRVPGEQIILLPTGDGMCIALLNVDDPFDIHIQVGLEILRQIHHYDLAGLRSLTKLSMPPEPMRRFEVRVGINANLDNLVTDINGRRNVAGAGINMAQRVMSSADGSQILVGQPVLEVLRHRESYMALFRPYVSHLPGISLPVYQYIGDSPGLNTTEPSRLVQGRAVEPRLSRVVAYYLAHAMRNRKTLAKRSAGSKSDDPSTVLLWFLAKDSGEMSEAREIDPFRPMTWGWGQKTFEEQLEYYEKADFWVGFELATFVEESLAKYGECFEKSVRFSYHFVSAKGQKKLQVEHPDVWKDFGFETAPVLEPPPG